MANAKITSLQEKRRSLNALIQKEQAKHKAGERRADTRRKVLAGATVLQWATKDKDFEAKLREQLQGFLTKPADRALFDLPIEDGQN